MQAKLNLLLPGKQRTCRLSLAAPDQRAVTTDAVGHSGHHRLDTEQAGQRALSTPDHGNIRKSIIRTPIVIRHRNFYWGTL